MERRYLKRRLLHPARSRKLATGQLRCRTPEDDQIAHKHLHRLVVLIERRSLHFDHTLIGPRLRRSYLEHFAFDVQLVSRADGPRPTKFLEASANDAARRLKFAFTIAKVVPVPMATLRSDAYAIVLRTSPADGNWDIFCGDVKSAA